LYKGKAYPNFSGSLKTNFIYQLCQYNQHIKINPKCLQQKLPKCRSKSVVDTSIL